MLTKHTVGGLLSPRISVFEEKIDVQHNAT